LEQLQDAVVFTFVSLFAMVNPIGMAAVFLELTRDYPVGVRHTLAYKVAIYGFLLLVVALFVGPYVLNFFGVSLQDIQIAGGIYVFYTAWGMLTARPKVTGVETQEAADSADIAFFPLTMPITAGAGSLAITISLSSKISHPPTGHLAVYGGAIIGIALVFISVALCYRFADAIFRRIGHVGTNVITRLTAFILLAIGVEIVWGGLKPLILGLSAK
jgi:multiple antibiotic resistance protein